MVALRAPSDLIADMEARKVDRDFIVHQDCQAVVNLFLLCDTQWRVADGMATGFDFSGVLSVMRFLRMKPTSALLADLKIMERSALVAAGDLKKKTKSNG